MITPAEMARKCREENQTFETEDLYSEMVEGLANFVIRTAIKDNPTPAEINAMVEITKILFRTI